MTKRPQGRPTKPSGEKQSKRLQVMVTPNELKVIQARAQAAKQTVSTFLRAVILKTLGVQ